VKDGTLQQKERLIEVDRARTDGYAQKQEATVLKVLVFPRLWSWSQIATSSDHPYEDQYVAPLARFKSAEKVPGALLVRAAKDLAFQNSARGRGRIIGSGEGSLR